MPRSSALVTEAKKSTAAKKSAAPADGEKKKRKKVRKETYSSYIYKGESAVVLSFCSTRLTRVLLVQC